MNYIEFEIGGKLRGFKLGLKFLGDILDHYDTDIIGFGNLLDNNPFQTRPAILYFAHLSEVQRKNNPVTFTLNDFIDWVDELEGGISNENVIQTVILVLESVKKHIPKSDEPVVEEKGKKK